MQIFYVHSDPQIAAESLCDKHCNKQIIESAQMLANAYASEELKLAPKTKKGEYRKYSYLHHPCSKWVLQSLENWQWLLTHGLALVKEKYLRTKKLHYTSVFLEWCDDNTPNLPSIGMTSPSMAIPEHLQNPNIMESYREYYKKDKLKNIECVWTLRQPPDWILDDTQNLQITDRGTSIQIALRD